MTQTRDWAAIGMSWDRSEVGKGTGSDWRSLGVMDHPVIDSVQKCLDAGLETAIMAGCNGTSWRVAAQDVGRAYLIANGKRRATGQYELTEEQHADLREKIYDRVRGLRVARAGTKTVVTHNLPDGTLYSGTDEVEYRQTFAAKLIDLGVPAAKALELANGAKWA